MGQEKTPMGNMRSPIGLTQNKQLNVIKEMITPQAFYARELGKISGKKAGWVDGGLCPFHPDKQEGSFRINLSSGAFKCFACDTGGGDIIAFVRTFYRLTFREALAKLTKDWGISLC